LCENKKNVPIEVLMQVLAIMNAIHNFISGENFFRPMLKLHRQPYIERVKDTLKFIFIPAFAGGETDVKNASAALPLTLPFTKGGACKATRNPEP
ncbi:MAG: hypothetical protein JRJ60_11635, partial [Deltaproteobacteria bacterium]|nr:hypothetical protein [Deltaproteobacteria bacterium]